MDLPEEYFDYLRVNGNFEGFTIGEPGYIRLWPVQELDLMNSEILIGQFAPGYCAFASDGGNEILAFVSHGAVFKIPVIGMDPQYAIRIAENFSELIARFQDTRITQKY